MLFSFHFAFLNEIDVFVMSYLMLAIINKIYRVPLMPKFSPVGIFPIHPLTICDLILSRAINSI